MSTISSMPIVMMGLLLMTSCEQDPVQSEPYKQLLEDQDRMARMVAEKDSTINAFFGSFNRISENLRTIREKQGRIGMTSGNVETDADMETRMMNDLQEIDALLNENKDLIARLKKDAKANAGRIVELERTIEGLERNIQEKNEEIGTLKEQLASTNSSLATLIEMYRDKEQLANMQRNEMNTVYYAIGTAKELRGNGVVTKEGGVAGIGSVNKLNVGELNKEYFTEIDKTRTQEIPVMAKKAKLVSDHPAGSYTWVGTAEKLSITDPDAFWSLSRFLVIETE